MPASPVFETSTFVTAATSSSGFPGRRFVPYFQSRYRLMATYMSSQNRQEAIE